MEGGGILIFPILNGSIELNGGGAVLYDGTGLNDCAELYAGVGAGDGVWMGEFLMGSERLGKGPLILALGISPRPGIPSAPLLVISLLGGSSGADTLSLFS